VYLCQVSIQQNTRVLFLSYVSDPEDGTIATSGREWNFDDGAPLNLGEAIRIKNNKNHSMPIHMFRTSGAHNVTLTVKDSQGGTQGGRGDVSMNITVSGVNKKPLVVITEPVVTDGLKLNTPINLKPLAWAHGIYGDPGDSIGWPIYVQSGNWNPVTRLWHWRINGVNKWSSKYNPRPLFTTAGSYDVALDTWDSHGETNSHTKTLKVYCGDGNFQPEYGEQCEGLGGVGEHQSCNSSCKLVNLTYCGDDSVQTPNTEEGIMEECDDGSSNSDSTPDACRLDCTNPRCGDLVIDTGEECDDGTTGSSLCTPGCVHINQAPVFNPPVGNRTVNEGDTLIIDLALFGSDVEPGLLTYSASDIPEGAVFNNATTGTGVFTWTPDYDQFGKPNPVVHFTVTDTDGQSDSQPVTINVIDVPQSPVLGSIGSQSVNENDTLTINLTATDNDDELADLDYSISISNDPGDSTFTDNGNGTATLTWTPDFEQFGKADPVVTFTVTDPLGQTDSEVVTIEVVNTNRPPKILARIGNKTIESGTLLSFTVTAKDPDGDDVTFISTLGLPAGAVLTNHPKVGTAIFTWTPTVADFYPMTFIANDGNPGGTDSEAIWITVINPVNPEQVYIKSQEEDGTFNINTGDYFGLEVAVYGNIMVVGSVNADKEDQISINLGHNYGAAYIYRDPNGDGDWSDRVVDAVLRIQPPLDLSPGVPDPAGRKARFGNAIAIHGDTIVVGEVRQGDYNQAVYVFKDPNNDGNWSELNDHPSHTYTGADGKKYPKWVQRFQLIENPVPAPAAVDQPKLTAYDPALGVRSRFGDIVAVHGDTIVVGAPRKEVTGVTWAGEVHAFEA